ncbi:MAG: ATP-binding protein [Bacteroidales bacterium]|nr:ATP-binding protein [Bacteroidales bacterium]
MTDYRKYYKDVSAALRTGWWCFDVAKEIIYYDTNLISLLGIDYEQISLSDFLLQVDPLQRGAVEDAFRIFPEIRSFNETFIFSPGGKPFELRGILNVIEDDSNGRVKCGCGALMILNDQLAGERHRKQVHERLRKGSPFVNLSLETVRIYPWEWDLSERGTVHISIADRKRLYSSNQEEYIGTIYPDDQELYRDMLDSFVHGGTDHFSLLYRSTCFSKQLRWYEMIGMAYRYDDSGRCTKAIGVIKDITELKRSEEAHVEERRRREENNRRKSMLLSNVSHEIRTPLNAIVGFSGLLDSTIDKMERREYLKIIRNNNETLLQLISNMLDLSRIEAGTLEFEYSEFDINDLLSEALCLSQAQAERKGLYISFTEQLPECVIRTERVRLLQVFSNLLANAIKFTSQGGIRVGYRLPDEKALYFYVSDTGCGISSDKRDSIFDRFVKLENHVPGTGLGLPICRTIVERLGGEIGVESKEGKGSTFWFTLPISVLVSKKVKNISGETRLPKVRSTLLIAEDNEDNYRFLEQILKSEYQLVHAWDGCEAVDLFRRCCPQLVLMDMKMPKKDGLEAFKEIRREKPSTPVIAVTAHALEEDEERILKDGFDGYFSKPVDEVKLKEKILSLLAAD